MKNISGWRDGSSIQSPGHSFRGSGFDAQYPHGDSQASVTNSPLLASKGTRLAHGKQTYTQANIHINNKKI